VSGRKVVGWSIVAFSAVLAVIVGNRMSAEAMAVVIGVVCGVAAGVPTSAIILALSRRSHAEAHAEPRVSPAPPIYVVTPGPALRGASPWPDGGDIYPAAAVPAPRQYRIIGDEP